MSDTRPAWVDERTLREIAEDRAETFIENLHAQEQFYDGDGKPCNMAVLERLKPMVRESIRNAIWHLMEVADRHRQGHDDARIRELEAETEKMAKALDDNWASHQQIIVAERRAAELEAQRDRLQAANAAMRAVLENRKPLSEECGGAGWVAVSRDGANLALADPTAPDERAKAVWEQVAQKAEDAVFRFHRECGATIEFAQKAANVAHDSILAAFDAEVKKLGG